MANRSKSIHPILGKQLKELRQERGLTQRELSERLGKSESTVRMWELGKSEPDLETLNRLARIFGVTADGLLGKEVSNRGNLSSLPDGLRMIPVFESVSAGLGTMAQDDVVDYCPCYIPSLSEAEETICLRVKGDSMYPKIEDGDVIQVHKQESVDSGSIAVVLLDGDEGLVKRVLYGEDWIELVSINPMYPPIRLEGPDVLRLRVVGAVRKIIKDV